MSNNRALYTSLVDFIYDCNLNMGRFDSQVPTSLILTSSESASSVDTQFEQLTKELEAKVKAKVVSLDEKKCINTKGCIDYIVRQIYHLYGKTYKEKHEKFERVRNKESD